MKKNKVTKRKTSKKETAHYSFAKKIVFKTFVFLLLFAIGTLLLNKSLKFEKTEIITYNEKSNLDYKVYLFKNDFYEQAYLDKDMLYVASLIDKVNIDFNYKFEIDDNETLDFTYKILGKLSITNKEGTKAYFEKTYQLLDSKTVSMKNQKEQTINETVNIDYPYYNSLANKFKNSYGLDTDSNLVVYMMIDKKTNQNSNFTMNNNSIMNVKIPLSEKSINIELDYTDINKSSTVLKEKNLKVSNIISLAISGIFILLSLVMVIKIVRSINFLNSKKSAYDKYIKKVLKEYDRLIAETSTMINIEEKEIIRVSKFTELLDIHDNLQLPIVYYSVVDHEMAHFYINHDKTVYLMTIKSIDKEHYEIET